MTALGATMARRLVWPLFGLAAAAAPAAADPVADFYRGQTLTIVVGSDPGGGYDSYARPVSRRLGALIPGEPNIVIKSMPGAAGLVAENYLYNSAPRDGLWIGAPQRQVVVEPLRGNAAARYDPFKFNWLGSVTAETAVLFVDKNAPHRVPADMLTKPLILANLGAGTDSEVEATAMRRLHGAPINLISGYAGTPEALLAVERGEAQGVHGISWSYIKTKKADWLAQGRIRLVLQSGLKPHPDLKDVPSILELARTQEDRDVWDLIVAPKAASRPYVAPPGAPADRLAALNEAFEKLMRDPAFLADMGKLQLEVAPASGAEIVDMMRRLYAFPQQTVLKMRAAIATGG